MTKLYIGNATKQRHAFMFNPPDTDGGENARGRPPITQFIQPCSVVVLSGDWTSGQIEAIIDQHKPYGLVDVSEVDRTRAFAGQCYSIDKPILGDLLLALMEHNVEVLDERGRKMRELAAVAVNNDIETEMRERGMPGKLAKVEMVVEEERNARSNTPETAPQRIRVERNEDENQAPRGARRKTA